MFALRIAARNDGVLPHARGATRQRPADVVGGEEDLRDAAADDLLELLRAFYASLLEQGTADGLLRRLNRTIIASRYAHAHHRSTRV